MGKKGFLAACLLGVVVFWSCGNFGKQKGVENPPPSHKRIVSLAGAITETMFLLGAGGQLVGVDVTSTSPKDSISSRNLPVLGHVSQLNAEGLISLGPDEIWALDTIPPEVEKQVREAGVSIHYFPKPHSLSGASALITSLGERTGFSEAAQRQATLLEAQVLELKDLKNNLNRMPPVVVFVYGRGAGSLMVAGSGTQADGMIQEAGGKNPFAGQFEGFKPLTSEAMVEAAPEVLLFFSDAYPLLGGESGVLEIPGVKATPAGKNKRFVHMDGHYLMGFGPRAGEAALELFHAIYQE